MEDIMTEEARYGISALSMEYKDNATEDELLLDAKVGKPYYKREDGQIVSYDNLSYSLEELPIAINVANKKAALKIDTLDDFIVYHTIDIASKVDLLSSDLVNVDIDNSFANSPNEETMYFRIHGDMITNAVMSYLEKIHDKKNSDKSLIEVTLSIVSDDTTKEVTIGCKFNTLTAVSLDLHSEKVSKVTVKSIKSNLIDEIYDELPSNTKTLISQFNNGNTRLEATEIDILTYLSDISNVSMYSNGVNLKCILPSKTIDDFTSSINGASSEGIIISKEKPDYKCIWGKILSVENE